MRLLRRRINTFFGLQAILLFLSGLRVLLDPKFARGISPVHHWLFLTGYLLLSLIFAKAWRVTRKPSPQQETWARAAASISIAAGAYLIWAAYLTHTFVVPGIICFLIGLATYFTLFQSRRALDPEPGPASANLTGD
jgi:cation transport ATPase